MAVSFIPITCTTSLFKHEDVTYMQSTFIKGALCSFGAEISIRRERETLIN